MTDDVLEDESAGGGGSNTKLLIELSEDLDPKSTQKTAKDDKYRELFRMYQFVIDENSELKK